MRSSRSTTICCSRPTRGSGWRSTIRGDSARSISCRRASWTSGRHSRRSGRSRSTSTRGSCSGGFAGGPPRSSCCWATSGIVAGLGNIYVCEALYRARIHPKRAGGSVSLERLEAPRRRRSRKCSPRRSRRAARPCAISSVPDGELGYFSKTFAVYDREGQPCGCGGTVKRIRPGRPVDILLPAPASAEVDDSGLSR